MTIAQRVLMAAGVAGLLSGAPSPSHATFRISDECKRLLHLIAEKKELLEHLADEDDLDAKQLLQALIRLKYLTWTSVYVQNASAQGSTCENLIKYLEYVVSKHSPSSHSS